MSERTAMDRYLDRVDRCFAKANGEEYPPRGTLREARKLEAEMRALDELCPYLEENDSAFPDDDKP